MADYYTLGPGTVRFGTVGDGNDFAMHLTACAVEPDVERGDEKKLMSGGVLKGASKRTANLTGTAVQDLRASGFLAYTWAMAGEEVEVEFVPSTAVAATKVTGIVLIDPLTIGGDAQERNDSDFEFEFVGFPTPTFAEAP